MGNAHAAGDDSRTLTVRHVRAAQAAHPKPVLLTSVVSVAQRSGRKTCLAPVFRLHGANGLRFFRALG